MKEHMQELPPPPIFNSEPTPKKLKIPKSQSDLTTYPDTNDDSCPAVRFIRKERARHNEDLKDQLNFAKLQRETQKLLEEREKNESNWKYPQKVPSQTSHPVR